MKELTIKKTKTKRMGIGYAYACLPSMRFLGSLPSMAKINDMGNMSL